MKNRLKKPMTRRAWMALTGAAVAGCGGGGGSLLAALPGTGGTGAVFAQGAISGFGSVIVNGIKFDDLQAAVTLNGVRAASADLRLGMVAEIQGQRGVDPTLGTAGSIDVWSVAQGGVTARVSGGFVVAGMTIRCDTATVLDGFASVGDIAVGATVSVWGLQNHSDANQWTATRVARATSGVPVVSSGLVRMMAGQPSLNGMRLDGEAVGGMADGALVRVSGTLSAPAVLQVGTLRLLNQMPMAGTDVSVEVQGFVTEMASARRFRIGSLDVDASAAVLSQAIVVGDRVEVYGYWNSGLLVASRVQLESEESLQLAELTGTVTEFNSLADFVVRGERCDASQAVFSHGVATDLRKDVLVKVEGTRMGAVLRVDLLEFED